MAQTLWINDLSGSINQYSSPGLLANNQAGILVNVAQSQLGNWSHRLGTDLFVPRISSSNAIRGLQMYEKNNSAFYLHAVHNGNMYVLNEGTSVWDQQEAAANTGLSSSSTVDFTNFVGKHYFIGSDDTEYLRFTGETGSSTQVTVITGTASSSSTGTTLVASTAVFNPGVVGFKIKNTTDNTTATIATYTNTTTVTLDTSIGDTWDGDSFAIYMDGKYLTTNGAFMLVGGGVANPRRVYWSGLEDDTFDLAADYAILDTPPTGIASFGNGRPFIAFTQRGYLTIDPNSGATDPVNNFGCVSHRSIGNLNGTLVWLGRNGFYMLAYNQAFPTEVSLPIRNDLTGDAIINKINGTNFAVAAAGVIGNRYYCALKDLSATVKGQTLNDCVVEFDYNQQAWRVHTFSQGGIAAVFATFINSNGIENLYAGSFDDGAVYKLEVPALYTDDNSTGSTATVTAVMQTKHYEFGDVQSILMKNIAKIHFKYKCASGGTITVKFALNGSTTYSSTPALTLPATPSGVDWDWKYFTFGKECKSISLQLETTSDFIIYGIGFEVDNLGNEGIDPI